ncbi:GAF domain-containing protein [Allobranchiibius sp. GilTou38]|uniref:GAF domain-containing protein n=1 Tax=Allobranchiibius sp. GilTou38 TaxID=2815210 RepID=UPI001AA1458D|nr:GAF domain-containing protein [Allobranchiibius sp. GilTou38]MBO1767313.1 transcriptional regulator [Allobranchiibius sp. GilTou38]
MSDRDRRDRLRGVAEARDRFVSTGETPEGLRPVVRSSWQRSIREGLDPDHSSPPVDLLDDDLEAWRAGHPLADAMPIIRRLLVDDAREAGMLVAVSDAAGRLMWVEGPTALRRRAEGIHFVEGALWSEAAAGTNAPGTALALDQPLQIFAAEHLARPVTAWSCSAAPIHDPDTGAVLGALDLTGGDDVAAPHTLTIVKATVAAVESELRLHRLTRASDRQGAGMLLRSLGRESGGALEGGHGITRMSGRHTELLVLLGQTRDGISGDRLAVELSSDDHAAVTVRAELSRLRTALAPLTLTSRPYRLDPHLVTDVEQVQDLLRGHRIAAALDLYRGPLLPTSDAPGICRLRDQLHRQVRDALIRAGDPDLLLRFADTAHGYDDEQVWRAVRDCLHPGSPRHDGVRAHLARLDRELG